MRRQVTCIKSRVCRSVRLPQRVCRSWSRLRVVSGLVVQTKRAGHGIWQRDVEGRGLAPLAAADRFTPLTFPPLSSVV